MEQQSQPHSPDMTHAVRTQMRARQLSTRLQAYDVALPKSLIPDPVPHDNSYHLPRMESPAAQLNLSGQDEPVSTVEQLPMGDLSLVQYGEDSAMSHQLDIERSVSHPSPSVAPPGYHSPSECDSFSSSAASPMFQVDVQARAISPPVVRPKATVVSSVPLPHLGQSFLAQTAHIDVSQQSALWHVTRATPCCTLYYFAIPWCSPLICSTCNAAAANAVQHSRSCMSANLITATYCYISEAAFDRYNVQAPSAPCISVPGSRAKPIHTAVVCCVRPVSPPHYRPLGIWSGEHSVILLHCDR